MRFLPVGDDHFIVELEDLEKTLQLYNSLITKPLNGLGEMIPAARTLLIRFDPNISRQEDLINQISARNLEGKAQQHGKVIEIPVHYNGEDLNEVAEILGLSVEDVIRRHTQSDYIVAFTGFAPGFAYLVNGDPIFDLPRRKTPRTRIPAGSIGFAGRFSGIYPQASPGGWQLIGITDVPMFDLSRTPPALLQPGMHVHFRDAAKEKTTVPVQPHPIFQATGTAVFKVTAAPMPVFYQDNGRHNVASQGVCPSGALDQSSAHDANRLVGNETGETVLEINLGGFAFHVLERAVIALTGADSPITIKTANGKTIKGAYASALALEAGDEVSIGYAQKGARAYLGIRGGFDAENVLSSASTDTLSHLGPRQIIAGDTLYKKRQKPTASVMIETLPKKDLPQSGDTVTLDVVMGPRADWFTPEAIALFTSQLWHVSEQSNRVGARLEGATPLERSITNELPSEGTVTGALQVPPSGQPVLFLKDRPLTGGYPVIAVIASHHLDLAGQIPVGAKIRFRAIAPFHELQLKSAPAGHQKGTQK